MKTKLLFFLCLLPALLFSQEVVKLTILHTNDLHSRLNGFSPENEYTPLTVNDDNTRGGFSRIASVIDEEKSKSENVIIMDAGDFLMGTPFPFVEESTGFQLTLMKKMGYDIVCLGNHEFDFGPEVLGRIIGKSYSNGEIPLLVASSPVFSDRDNKDDQLKELYDKGAINRYRVFEMGGLKIGVFSVHGNSAIEDAPLARPVSFSDPVRTARKYVDLLRNKEKVDFVISLSHIGISKDEKGNWSGEAVEFVKKVKGIDLLISGHSHTLLGSPVIVNSTPIVQAGSYGTTIGKVEIAIRNKKVENVTSSIIDVDDKIRGVASIQQMISEQEKLVSHKILKGDELTFSSVICETSFPLIYDPDTLWDRSNLGPLIADAIYSYVNTYSKAGTDVVLFPAGLIFDNILPGKTGKQSLSDIFRVVPMGSGKDSIPGYALARIYVTAKELKGIMEILYLAPKSGPDNYMYFGGLRARFDPEKGLLKKIVSIETGDNESGFTPLDWSKKNTQLYSITADSYVLEFVGLIKKLSHHLVNVNIKNEKGEKIGSVSEAIIDADPAVPGVQEMKEWLSLLWFLQNQPDRDGDGIPEISEDYRTASPRMARE